MWNNIFISLLLLNHILAVEPDMNGYFEHHYGDINFNEKESFSDHQIVSINDESALMSGNGDDDYEEEEHHLYLSTSTSEIAFFLKPISI